MATETEVKTDVAMEPRITVDYSEGCGQLGQEHPEDSQGGQMTTEAEESAPANIVDEGVHQELNIFARLDKIEAATTAIIRIGPEHDPAVLTLAEEARKLRDYAAARLIATDADLKPATDDLSIISKAKKALSEKKAEYFKPIKAHIDAVNDAFLSIMAPLDEADLIIRNKIKDYRAAVEKRRLEAEEINRQKQELARREAAFNGTGEITIDTTPIEAPATIKRVTTTLGSIGTMKVTKWEVVNFAAIPDEYKLIDAGKVTKLVKAGGSIPGIRVWEEETLRVNAR